MNYKDTLNLPKTSFSMKANLRHLESNILCYWENLDIYGRIRQARKGKEKFILHDGPPYANGLIHIGHALNKILKDIIVRFEFLNDFDCPFVVGWDCHGLPVEHQLFKKLELTKHDVDVIDFRKQAKEFALKYVELQKEDFKRLGIFSDWNNPYLTLNTDYEYGAMKLLEYLVGEGFVYRGRKPVNWCPTCETALAEAEVEYADKQSHSIFFLFEVIDDKGIINSKDANFLVWTTTPWTVVSNVAVAVHPKLEYCLVAFNQKTIILAKDLIADLASRFGVEFKVLKTFKGIDLEGIKLAHPFLDRQSPVLLADFVSNEDGSGCVHIAPGHGQEDFSLTKKYSLEVLMPVDDRGIFQEPADFVGQDVKQANETVIDKLNTNGRLIKNEKINHSYPHCWRCKNPIIFRATFQWFLNVDHNNLRGESLKEIEKVKWIPPSGFDRMKGMLLTRPDWCLSRQRLWGIPIPSIKCDSCDEVILDAKIISNVAEAFKKGGSDSWFSCDVGEFLPSDFTCFKCGGSNFSKGFDILDVWFESGASFLSVVKNNPDLNYPADLYLEGSDQHRGWFQVSLIPSVAKEKIAPFKTILTHGFVVDKDGKKMSKSLGNVISPQEIIKDYGAEILRLWVAYSDYSEDVKISDDIVKQLVDMYRKIRNTIRFILGSIYDFDPDQNSPQYDSLLEVDKYMLSATMLFADDVIASYNDFSFYKVCQKIFNFCNQTLSSFYLDILKDRLYTFSPNSHERRCAQFVLWHIIKLLLKIIAPILSFTAEEAYFACKSIKNKEDSIFISTFKEDINRDWIDEKLMTRWQKILALREAVYKEIEKAREVATVRSSLEAGIVILCAKEDYILFDGCRDMLKELFIVSDVAVKEGDYQIIVNKVSGEKCPRCWNWCQDIGKSSEFPDVCLRCAEVLKDIKNTA
ncbi:MAG: isoleucine--tRNA ligase [Candidatus Omnitrophica bacterium]|nr:isoleucine--tRNA ligase [Candidatus Omnitrophota bacterium]